MDGRNRPVPVEHRRFIRERPAATSPGRSPGPAPAGPAHPRTSPGRPGRRKWRRPRAGGPLAAWDSCPAGWGSYPAGWGSCPAGRGSCPAGWGYCHAVGETAVQKQAGRDVGAELGQRPGLVRALQRPGRGGGPFPDPRGGVGGQVGVERGHAVAVRDELDPPVRGTLLMALLDAHRVVAFPPHPGLGPEPARRQLPRRTPPGRVRASGSRKCASSAAAPAASRLAVSSTMIRACCHEIDPASRAPKGQRQRRRQHLSVGQQGRRRNVR